MAEDLGTIGLCGNSPDGSKYIMLGSDAEELPNLAQHEYAHSQSAGLNTGYIGYLFRGLNEAVTESVTTSPMNYTAQRQVLERLYSSNPNLEQLCLRAYRGDPSARKKFFSSIVNEYGLGGFLALARLSPGDNDKPFGNIGVAVKHSPQKVMESIS